MEMPLEITTRLIDCSVATRPLLPGNVIADLDSLNPLLKMPRFVMPMYPDTLLLPDAAPGRVLFMAGSAEEIELELASMVSEERRLCMCAERGMTNGGGIMRAELDRVDASIDGLLVCAPRFCLASSFLVGVITIASLKSICAVVGNGGSRGGCSDGVMVVVRSDMLSWSLRGAASL